MNKDQIVKLVSLIEAEFVGILVHKKICSYIQQPMDKKDNKLSNIKILEPYNTEVSFITVENEKVEAIRALYPKGTNRRGDLNTIRLKLEKFLFEYPIYNYNIIYSTIQRYVQDMVYSGNTGILFDLNNIFYKLENKKFSKSPIIQLIEKYNVSSELVNPTVDIDELIIDNE